jgi:Fe-S-cluster-containing dehydrogenase component/DMSO reductase anchor subunit
MRRGFDFDAALCVACNACNTACMIENGFQPGTRSVCTWNSEALPLLSVINLSMACNHCEKPSCLEGCPARAYTFDSTGAVIHHQDRCMGCRYCTWRCPYDAPKINEAKGFIEKCHFCTDRAARGIEPACTAACPTGALRMTEQDEFPSAGAEWFPDTGIKPSLKLRVMDGRSGPLIVPVDTDEEEEMPPSLKLRRPEEEEMSPSANLRRPKEEYIDNDQPAHVTKLIKEWSLLIFSLLVVAASALIIASALKDPAPALRLPALMLTGALCISFAHLGVRANAWRAILNVASSPLSREILMVIITTALAYLNWFIPGMIHPVIQAVVALLTLITADLVYFAADRSPVMKLHSGQMFFSGIFMASWFIVPSTVFLVFSMLAAVSVIMRSRSLEKGQLIRSLYYLRALSVPVVFLLLYPDSKLTTTIAAVLFLAGITADRALFIDDFHPVNIKETISDHFINEYEEERDKQRQNAGIS